MFSREIFQIRMNNIKFFIASNCIFWLLILGACSQNEVKNNQVPSVKNDHTVNISIDDLYDTSDDYANWVHFGVGGPA